MFPIYRLRTRAPFPLASTVLHMIHSGSFVQAYFRTLLDSTYEREIRPTSDPTAPHPTSLHSTPPHLTLPYPTQPHPTPGRKEDGGGRNEGTRCCGLNIGLLPTGVHF